MIVVTGLIFTGWSWLLETGIMTYYSCGFTECSPFTHTRIWHLISLSSSLCSLNVVQCTIHHYVCIVIVVTLYIFSSSWTLLHNCSSLSISHQFRLVPSCPLSSFHVCVNVCEITWIHTTASHQCQWFCLLRKCTVRSLWHHFLFLGLTRGDLGVKDNWSFSTPSSTLPYRNDRED